jgi:FAD/FMN-containing dehydrogenase
LTQTASTSSPLALQRPASSDALAAAIAGATAAGAQVNLVGSGSMPRAVLSPGRPVQPISTLRCNSVIEHAVADMTVITHAGITLDALQQQLAWHNQFLPVDPPALAGRIPVQRTIGGLIATNSLGPLRHKYGDWRFLMLGMRWIDGNGTLIKGGGRTVKNVAGYSTPRMMIGSAGTLGAIAEVTLRTFARPTDEQCLIVFCDTPEQAEEILAAVSTAALEPAYVQAIGSQGFAGNPLKLPVRPIALAIGFLDRPNVCAAQIDMLRKMPQLCGVNTLALTAAQCGRLRLWMTSQPAGPLHFRIHAMPSQVSALIARIEADATSSDTRCSLVAEAGNGVLRGSLPSGDAHACNKFFAALAYLCDGHAAELVLLQADPALAVATRPTARPLYQRIKSQLDPKHTFGDLPGTI